MERTIVNENNKIWVTVSTTINLGNYENTKIEVGRSQTIKRKDNPLEIIDDITDELLEILDEKRTLIKKEK